MMMTVVVRETELEEDFTNNAYMAFVSDEIKLHNMGHSEEVFERSNAPLTFQFRLTLDNNWRLESEQRRVSELIVNTFKKLIHVVSLEVMGHSLLHY